MDPSKPPGGSPTGQTPVLDHHQEETSATQQEHAISHEPTAEEISPSESSMLDIVAKNDSDAYQEHSDNQPEETSATQQEHAISHEPTTEEIPPSDNSMLGDARKINNDTHQGNSDIHPTYTTTATFVDHSSLSLDTMAGSIPASVTASAPLFNKNTSYTFKALNCNASSSSVISGINTSSKNNNIPADSIYLPAQATAGEMKLPNSSKSVPMVMVPVPDGRTLMAIPMSSLNDADMNQFTTQASKSHPTSMEFLKNNPHFSTQLQGQNLNLSGTLMTIQIPSTVTGTTVVNSSIYTTITDTNSLTNSKTNPPALPNPVKPTVDDLPIPATTAPTVTTTTNSCNKDVVSVAKVPPRSLQSSQTVTTVNTSRPQNQSSDKPLLDEQAKKLLRWSNGIGTLEGCDFKFTLNEFGDLEVLDSEDEEDNEDLMNKSQDQIKRKHDQPYMNGINDRGKKKRRHFMNFKPSCLPRKVLPGSSLLSGGPDDKLRRTKPSTFIKPRSHQPLNSLTDASNNINSNWQHLIEKLMPQDGLSQFKMEDVDSWQPDAVKKFVDSIAGCAGNGCLFEYQQICGRSLMLMNQRDIVEILNIKLGPAVKIYHAILLVKEQSSLEQSKKTTMNVD